MSKVSKKKLVLEQNVSINYFFFRQEHYQTIRRTNNGYVPGAVTAKVKSIKIKIVFFPEAQLWCFVFTGINGAWPIAVRTLTFPRLAETRTPW